MSFQKLLSIPHIQSAIFQYLYFSDISQSIHYDSEDDAFKFCKAVSANIYTEKNVMLNQLKRELLSIERQIVYTGYLNRGINRHWGYLYCSGISHLDSKEEELYNNYIELKCNMANIKRSIASVEFYMNFNLEYNKDYEPDYQF